MCHFEQTKTCKYIVLVETLYIEFLKSILVKPRVYYGHKEIHVSNLIGKHCLKTLFVFFDISKPSEGFHRGDLQDLDKQKS
jgi:hypothetical protein